MKANELRELDAWIAENVMGWKEVRPWSVNPDPGQFVVRHGVPVAPHPQLKFQPTTDPAAAMEVLKKCAVEIASLDTIHLEHGENLFSLQKGRTGICAEAETIELAICLFAKKLFSNVAHQPKSSA